MSAKECTERLRLFIKYQRRWWKKVKKGEIIDPTIIMVWIESCDDAEVDIAEIEKELKGA